MTTKQEPQLTAEGQAFAALMAEMEQKLMAMEARLSEAEAGKGKMPKDDNKPMTREDTPEPGGAWIVKAPLETYTGETAGIKFTNGWGVVYPDGADAVRKVHQLEHDFLYQVLSVDAKTLADFQKRMSGVKVKQSGGLAEKLSVAQVVGK
jgi:hypothetical protein